MSPSSFPPAFRRIITHPGRAHRDETYACALLLAACPGAEFARREPGAEELADPATAVVDIGGDDEPARGNFDHHQLADESGAPPVCALTLVLRALGRETIARAAWPWLEPLEWVDARGPAAAAARWTPGLAPTAALLRLQSPADGWLLRRCEAGDAPALRAFGAHLLGELEAVAARWERLGAGARFFTVAGLEVLDTRAAAAGEEHPTLGVEAWLAERRRAPAVVVAWSERTAGRLNLVRRLDHPRVDFRRLAGEPGVTWVHANGFLAEVEPLAPAALERLLALAITLG